jgi:Ca-activated chloride channel family protein
VYYNNPGVNPFIDAEDDPLSTFALDVDTGSYTVARRYLSDGFLPDKDSVRVEEFVNYFEQGYEAPTLEEGLALSVDGGPTPFLQNPRNQVIRVGVQAGELEVGQRGDANLVFVIDTSGSMEREDRLGLVKQSLELLVGALRPTDTIGIVQYGTNARLVLPPTPVAEEGRIFDAIASLRPEGSTNAAEGLVMGYGMANEAYRPGGINRVVLSSDGVANMGSATDAEGILDLISDEAENGIEMVTVGFGMGNYNDVLMEQLADQGDGFYAYVDTIDEARRLFVEGLNGTLQTVAKEAKIQVEFDPAVVQSWRLIGFENRALEDDDFADDSVDAGEIGAGHTVTALYEVKPVEESLRGDLGVAKLRWLDPATNASRETQQPISVESLAPAFEATDVRFQLDVVVAQYAEVLRESLWAQQTGSDLADVATWGDHLMRVLPEDPDVTEFVGLMTQAAAIES